ncbi:sensor domain-containing diguanylate cyclase [Sulfurovum sp.]|uniref:sensor domain-containing diguanylate cyclase n=1 Tax=Sulfurovum sp. TaxID=1969726 RepID=UPI0025DC8AA6|nr:sensor domain-containing diguanylate cyclase [Sulfurovum sp.]
MNYPTVTKDTTDKELSEVFCKIGMILTSSLQPKEVIHRVMELIGNYFSPRNWSLLLIEESTERLKFEIVMGVDAQKSKGLYIAKGEGIVGWVCEHGKPTIVEDTAKDDRFSPRIDSIIGFKTHSVVCVPLLNGQNKVIGAIELVNKIVSPSTKSAPHKDTKPIIPTYESFTNTDMEILSSIATFTGIAVENAFLYKKVEELAMVDSLTGINNRHYFNEVLRQETEKVKRYRHPICLLIMDVDNFKMINDTFGHVTGDRILRSVADILRVAVRESDFLARFGGDEFVIIMPEAKESHAFVLAKRIQDMIARWNAKESTPGLKMNLSIGIHEGNADNIDTLLAEADRDLYQCKVFRKRPEELTSPEEMQRYLWFNLDED